MDDPGSARGGLQAWLFGLAVGLIAILGCGCRRETLQKKYPIGFAGFARNGDPEWRIKETTLGPAQPALTDEPPYVTVTGTFADESRLVAAHRQVALLLELSAAWYEQSKNAEARKQLLASGQPVLTPPVRAFLSDRGLPVAVGGIGWRGESGSAASSVKRVGQTLYVEGLRGYSQNDLAHPLVPVFHWLGAERVLAEGDHYGQGTIVVDFQCTAQSEDLAGELTEELLDYFSSMSPGWLRPPWHAEGVSAREAQARATYRRLVTDERAARRDPGAHPGVVAKFDEMPDSARASDWNVWRKDIGSLMGQLELLPVDDRGHTHTAPGEDALTAAIGFVRRQARRVDVAFVPFSRFGAGFPAFVHYLWDRGCGGMSYDLVDFEEVRGD